MFLGIFISLFVLLWLWGLASAPARRQSDNTNDYNNAVARGLIRPGENLDQATLVRHAHNPSGFIDSSDDAAPSQRNW